MKKLVAAFVALSWLGFALPSQAYEYKYTPSTASGGSKSAYSSNYSSRKR